MDYSMDYSEIKDDLIEAILEASKEAKYKLKSDIVNAFYDNSEDDFEGDYKEVKEKPFEEYEDSLELLDGEDTELFVLIWDVFIASDFSAMFMDHVLEILRNKFVYLRPDYGYFSDEIENYSDDFNTELPWNPEIDDDDFSEFSASEFSDVSEKVTPRFKNTSINRKRRKFMAHSKAYLIRTKAKRRLMNLKKRQKRRKYYKINKIRIKKYQKSRANAIKKRGHKVKIRRISGK